MRTTAGDKPCGPLRIYSALPLSEADGALSFARTHSRATGARAPSWEPMGREPAGPKGASPSLEQVTNADGQSAHSQAAGDATREEESAGPAAEPAKARRLHARLHDDAEKAELGVAQGREGAADQRLRSHRLHPRR